MKRSYNAWVVLVFVVMVVWFAQVQYHWYLPISWLRQGGDAGSCNAAGAPVLPPRGVGGGGDGYVDEAVLDRAVRGVAERLQLHPALAASVDHRLLREFSYELAQPILAAGCPGVRKRANFTSNIQESASTPLAARPIPPSSIPPPSPPLYIITPTYRRAEQIPELTRLAQTLMHVRNIFWLVIEDASSTTQLVSELLIRTGIPYAHLTAPMPEKYNRRVKKPKGVSNRNRGLAWLRANATTGVFFFADDDNTYDLQLFEEMRTTQKVAMWPVAFLANFGIGSPIVVNGTFKGFYSGWVAGRKFPVDMAGFAVNVEFLLQRPNASMPYLPGYEEDGFLRSLAPFEPSEIELKAQNCTKLLVWHTQTRRNPPSAAIDMTIHNNTNLVLLKQLIV